MTGMRSAGGASQQLVDLVLNPADPGYRAATERRRALGITHRWYDRPAAALGCLLIGFTLAFAYANTHRGAPRAAKIHASLVERVRTAERTADTLNAQLAELSDKVTAARDSALSGQSQVLGNVQAALVAAGQTAVRGPGLRVTLSNPPQNSDGASRSDANLGALAEAPNTLSDRDIRSVLNQLWSDGAEAIAVNDIRIAPTSSVRFAGEVVLVDLHPISSPYVLKALGDPDSLATRFASSEVAARYATQASANGIGFGFTESKRLMLPASNPVTLNYARTAP